MVPGSKLPERSDPSLRVQEYAFVFSRKIAQKTLEILSLIYLCEITVIYDKSFLSLSQYLPCLVNFAII